jgi:hypothetical protein
VFELRGMQAVRQRLNVGRKIPNLSGHFPNFAVEIGRCGRKILLHDTQMHTEQRKPLADVVVKLARDTRPLLLVRFDQLLTGNRRLRELPFGDVHDRADVTNKRPVGVPSGHTGRHHPAILAIVAL